MHNVQTAAPVTEAFATELIFDACRANEKREQYNSANGYTVTFRATTVKGEHQAVVYNPNGYVVAGAVVDQFDC